MSNSPDLQQEIIQAEAKVNELREKLRQQKNNERLQAIASVKELIKLHQLSANDLGWAGKKSTPSKKSARIDKGISIAPKYADPATGKTWAGRGRVPDWLAEYLSKGRKKEDYLISNV
ncbi:MAG: H-NS histone family protein [Burkholderiales bacterium]|nr:H-NS histone family protein [Burkholderiales bacterium]